MRIFAPRLRDLSVEEFHLLALDTQSQVIREVLVTRAVSSTVPWCIRARFSGPPSPKQRPGSSWSTTTERRPDPLRRGSRGHATTGGRGSAAGPAGL